ncbi:hypothetical protein CHARACLAT_002987 [Characodon lateralis]|uniref:Uncharacterized protein n=1 Tax=Characodon lateralis TaxID=208331 RepID=A0ABU7CY56_9TELE|nr:hypothetical protein [Characodon lateralis]
MATMTERKRKLVNTEEVQSLFLINMLINCLNSSQSGQQNIQSIPSELAVMCIRFKATEVHPSLRSRSGDMAPTCSAPSAQICSVCLDFDSEGGGRAQLHCLHFLQ